MRPCCRDIPVLFPLGLARQLSSMQPLPPSPAFKAGTTGHSDRAPVARLFQHSIWVGCSVSFACQMKYVGIPTLGQ